MEERENEGREREWRKRENEAGGRPRMKEEEREDGGTEREKLPINVLIKGNIWKSACNI